MAFDLRDLISTLLFASLLLFPSVHATEIHYCDKNGDYEVKVKGVDMSPDPVVRGEPATFSISASTDKAIPRGKLVIDVSYFGFHIHSESYDLCEETSCPVSIGDFVLSHTQTLPGFTPPGSYTLKMKLVNGSGHQLTCITFDFFIGLVSSVADSYDLKMVPF